MIFRIISKNYLHGNNGLSGPISAILCGGDTEEEGDDEDALVENNDEYPELSESLPGPGVGRAGEEVLCCSR